MYQPTDFIPTDVKINSWNDLKPYFDKLVETNPKSVQELESLIIHFSEVVSVYAEQLARAYIKMTCHTENKDYVKRHEMFITDITPQLDHYSNNINKNIVASEFFDQLDSDGYDQFRKLTKRELEMFRKENIELDTHDHKLRSEYEQTAGKLLVQLDGKDIPIPQAQVKLESDNREERKKAWLAVQNCRYKEKQQFDKLIDKMIVVRHQMAKNAGYKNFRDFKHDDLARFDYTVDDVLKFHESIEHHVTPLLSKIVNKHRDRLELPENDFRPWDMAGKPKSEVPLNPFKSGKELLDKTKTIFTKLRPDFGANLEAMEKAELFDLESRPGKAPGGYNYGLEVTGMPFIFMNAAGVHRDVTTLMHEGGHAMHTFLTNNNSLFHYRNPPSEMAETASMSMELLTSSHWNEFYNEKAHKRARREHLEDIISGFPWIATVDSFQHWLYTNPEHSVEERDEHFNNLMDRFGTQSINWEGNEHFRSNAWQKQLHIFSVPFYYIEYAIAQIGALQVYRNYCQDPTGSLAAYVDGLKLGYSKPIPEVWEKMNIRFDFSTDTLKDLMAFVGEKLAELA
jgi:oligoendopeptidase F